MFFAAKLLAFATQPLAWALILLTLGLLLPQRWRKAGTRLCWAALLALVLTLWQAPVNALMHNLENQNPPPDPSASLAHYAGVVVLGGALSPSRLWQRPGQIALNGAAERMTVPVGLLQRNPHLKLLFTGGEGDLVRGELTEADRAKIFFDSMGVDASRVIYESRSRTTYDNAVLSARLPGVDIRQRWLLLTTAAHMPRSLGVFRKAGWNVTPYSVDYRTSEGTDWTSWDDWVDFSFTDGVMQWHYALHEIIGYWAYRLTGKI
jgi:uncharacterized SAM-binding protein YcdF (DUF218 family)